MKILLSGYYGFDNAGDEAVLYAIVQALREAKSDIEITVLSNQPEKTASELEVYAIDRWSKSGMIKAIKNCDILISGGGSLLQDVTSKNGILYYLGVIKLAQLLKKKVMIYAQGIGPVNNNRNRKLVRKILNKVDIITVRDLDSRMALTQMGVYREIMVCSDPVLGLSVDEINADDGKILLTQKGLRDWEKPILIVSVRNWDKKGFLFHEIAKYCDNVVKNNWQVVFLPFHYPEDIEAGKEIATKMQYGTSTIVLDANYTPQQTIAILKNSDMILGMRLHSLIMGAALLKPMVALSYDPKVESFMQLLRQKECYEVDTVTAEQLWFAMERLQNRSEREIATQKNFVEILARQAKEPVELLLELF